MSYFPGIKHYGISHPLVTLLNFSKGAGITAYSINISQPLHRSMQTLIYGQGRILRLIQILRINLWEQAHNKVHTVHALG